MLGGGDVDARCIGAPEGRLLAVDAPCLDRKRSPVEETSGGGRAHAKVSGGGGDAPCIGHGLRAG